MRFHEELQMCPSIIYRLSARWSCTQPDCERDISYQAERSEYVASNAADSGVEVAHMYLLVVELRSGRRW